ncbi:MAG: 3-methyl-2-oxobutanoate hydroxymethyltransferase [Rickettsiales bacterium]|nr:3-methyl-2-oxobutanoate hydroxymethyltransferase [Rickettsiales bacterium]
MRTLFDKKHQNKKIVAISCHTAPISNICSKYADILLVGDTVGMTLYGHKDTKNVTVEMMKNHGAAVVSAAESNNYTIIDMPFGSYEKDKEKALKNAQYLLKSTQADAIKLEGGTEIAETLKYLTEHKIPVVGHIGLLPQQISDSKDYRAQGKELHQIDKITNDLNLLLSLDIKIIVIECVYKELVDELIKNKDCIFIGIGASENCDGQILVADDIMGLTYKIKQPKFAKSYLDGKTIIESAIKEFSNDVRNKKFPSKENLYRQQNAKK